MSANAAKLKPVLFISHKHSDSKIADAIRTFVTMQSGGRVAVFQSSSPWAEAPKIGRNLNRQLIQTLWRSSVLILLYTNPDQDWNYCMWECGVATNPQSPDTKIILFDCTDKSPSLFAEQVNVNVRNAADVQKFAKEFLTAPDFFPGFEGPVTEFTPNGPEVINAAADFSEEIEPFLPPAKVDPTDEWPAYPFLQFELGLQTVEEIRAAENEAKHEAARELILSGCLISASDKYCEQLFGVPSFEKNTSFAHLVERWRKRYPQAPTRWVDALCNQILAGAMWELPPRNWELMQGFNDVARYAPVLNRIRKIPSSQCMQFDIYFYRLDVAFEKSPARPDSGKSQ